MINDLKNYTNNLLSGNLYTIAARPLMGKTTVARYIANTLSHHGQKVLYIETETLTKNEESKEYDFLCRRMISAEEIRNIAFIGNYDVIIIDNFQYMHHKIMDDTAYRLKRLSEELNLKIIVLSHISRKVDIRKNKRPIISDMTRKMCGSLWKSSDGVVFLWRESYYNRSCTNNDIEFIIAKDSNGISGLITLNYQTLERPSSI